MPADLLDVDQCLTDPSFFQGLEFHDLFRRLRAEDPVHWTEGNYERGFWSLTSYADCVALMSDATLFSNRAGPHLPPRGRAKTPEEDVKFGTDVHILMTDPPDHARRRRPMNKHFSVPVVTHLRPLFEEVVAEILDAAAAKNDIDLVDDVAAQLPVKVILRLLGVAEADWAAIQQMTVRALHTQDSDYRDPESGEVDELAAMVGYIDQVYQHVVELVRDRRAHPTDDYTSIIAQLRDGDDLFTEHEAGFMVVGVVLGGLEGTRNAASVGMRELLQRPDQARRLAADRALAKSTVEEVLRWTTPSKNRLRVATADTEIGGQQIKQGDWVVGWIASANRDESVFPDPDTFDLARTPNKHLAFGHGDHVCIGRAMARLELEILFYEMSRRFPEMAALGEAEWVASNNATGLKRFPRAVDAVIAVTFSIEETGEELVLDATGHATLMHVAIEHDISAIEGECGGDMTCGTCHVYVESVPDGYVAEQSADEVDMLEVVDAPTAASRLACQLPVDEHVAGLRLRVPSP